MISLESPFKDILKISIEDPYILRISNGYLKHIHRIISKIHIHPQNINIIFSEYSWDIKIYLKYDIKISIWYPGDMHKSSKKLCGWNFIVGRKYGTDDKSMSIINFFFNIKE